jgi:hypothetical protein
MSRKIPYLKIFMNELLSQIPYIESASDYQIYCFFFSFLGQILE